MSVSWNENYNRRDGTHTTLDEAIKEAPSSDVIEAVEAANALSLKAVSVNSLTSSGDISGKDISGEDITADTLTTTGNISGKDISGQTLTTTGDASIGGDLSVTGDVSAVALNTSGDATIGGDLTINNNVLGYEITDYAVENDHNFKVVKLGSTVIVTGVFYGTGVAGYVNVNLPVPYTPSGLGSALVFKARNQNTGDFVDVRCGGSFAIYREAAFTNGVPFAFSFSYAV